MTAVIGGFCVIVVIVIVGDDDELSTKLSAGEELRQTAIELYESNCGAVADVW